MLLHIRVRKFSEKKNSSFPESTIEATTWKDATLNFASNAYDDDERKRYTQEPSGPKNVELRIRMRHASYATSSLKFVSIRSFFGWRHFNCNFTALDMKSLKSVLRPSVYHLRRYFGGKFLSKLLNRQFIYLRIPQKNYLLRLLFH